MEMFKDAFNLFLNPETQTKKVIAKADFKQALININIIPFVLAVILGLFVSAASIFIGPFLSKLSPALATNPIVPMLLSIGAWAIILFPILSIVLISVSSIVMIWIFCAVAKLFGKKVDFLKLFYALSLIDLALCAILVPGYIVAILCMLVPVLGVVLYLIILAVIYSVAMYSIYAWFVVIKQLTGFDNLALIKFLAAWFIVAIIVFIVIVCIIVAVVILAMAPTFAPTGFFGLLSQNPLF